MSKNKVAPFDDFSAGDSSDESSMGSENKVAPFDDFSGGCSSDEASMGSLRTQDISKNKAAPFYDFSAGGSSDKASMGSKNKVAPFDDFSGGCSSDEASMGSLRTQDISKNKAAPFEDIFGEGQWPLEAQGPRPHYGRALAVGIVGQACLTWLLLAWSEKAGCLLGISPLVTGATVSGLACAAPTYLASMHLARTRGDLGGAMSNALGSNVFSLLFCFGFPWFLAALVEPGNTVTTGAVEDTIFALRILLLALFVLALSLLIRCLKQTSQDGLLYFMIYMTAIAALILHDYRISFEFSVEDSLPLGTGFKVRSG